MKTQKLTPATVAPVQRQNIATVSVDQNGISAQVKQVLDSGIIMHYPFAGDDAE